MKSISLEAAIIITERSKRTWWRRISEKVVAKVGVDTRGRTMLAFDDVRQFISIPLNEEDIDLIQQADAGNANAQNEIGQMFAVAGKPAAALYWFKASAEQNHPDAMHNLGSCYIAGNSVPKDENLGIMWIAKAASYGHVIAITQMKSLRPFSSVVKA